MARLWAKELPSLLIKEYQNALQECGFTRKKALAIEGLAELNDPLGIEICRTFLSDPNAHLRNRALESLVKLDKSNLKLYLEKSIQDSDKQIFHSCLKISADQANFFDQSVIENLAKKRNTDLWFFSEVIHYAYIVMGWKGLLYVSTIVEANLSLQEQAIVEQQLCSFLDAWSRSQVYQTIEETEFLKLTRWLNNDKLTSLNSIGNRIRFIFELTEKNWKKN